MLEKHCGSVLGMQACIDEAGRGSWAGRVYTAAVIWNPLFDGEYDHLIKDSKKLSPAKREMLYDYIKENAIDYSITYKDPDYIDQVNILNATMHSMHTSLDALSVNFDSIIVDGDIFNEYQNIPHTCIIGGDNKYIGIACASILAKVEHDRHMRQIAKEFPRYGWENNMGYGSKQHADALKEHGVTKYHRKSYAPIKALLHAITSPSKT